MARRDNDKPGPKGGDYKPGGQTHFPSGTRPTPVAPNPSGSVRNPDATPKPTNPTPVGGNGGGGRNHGGSSGTVKTTPTGIPYAADPNIGKGTYDHGGQHSTAGTGQQSPHGPRSPHEYGPTYDPNAQKDHTPVMPNPEQVETGRNDLWDAFEAWKQNGTKGRQRNFQGDGRRNFEGNSTRTPSGPVTQPSGNPIKGNPRNPDATPVVGGHNQQPNNTRTTIRSSAETPRDQIKQGCKARPKSNKPIRGGGGGKRRFIPWC